MSGTGTLLRTTLVMGLGVIVGAVTVAQVLAMRDRDALASRLAPKGVLIGADGRPDPLVTGSVGPAGQQTIILDPCTGLRKN